MLADSSKIGVVADVVICGFDQVDVVIVDDGVDDAVRDELSGTRRRVASWSERTKRGAAEVQGRGATWT